MNIQSLAFLALLSAAAGAYRLAGPARQVTVLLAAGAVFYLSGPEGAWRGAAVLALSAGVTYFAARRMVAAAPAAAKRWLGAGTVWHVLVLGGFKYLGFLSGGAWEAPFVPLGMSFFAFQQIWFLREVSEGRFSPGVSFREYLSYCFFFPTVSAGPILRPQAFFPQLRQAPPRPADTAAGLYALGLGFAKKVLLADNLGALVDNGWARLQDLSAPAAWCVIFGYALQLYFDFSGYCDIAAGSARLLGLRLPVNFDAPYRSLSVTEFWKRWHITLTDFLRETVYLPLGGSRGGTVRTCRNILLVFVVSGVWHGAGWTFLVWGLLHGAAQAAERLLGASLTALPRPLRWGGTFLFVTLAWVPFRAPGLAAAAGMMDRALRGGPGGVPAWLTEGVFAPETRALTVLLPGLTAAAAPLCAGLLLAVSLAAALRRENVVRRMDVFRPGPGNCLAVLVLALWAILSFSTMPVFIYSNF